MTLYENEKCHVPIVVENIKQKAKSQKQPPGGVPRKRCSENRQQIYRRTPMAKRNFNKVALLALQLY